MKKDVIKFIKSSNIIPAKVIQSNYQTDPITEYDKKYNAEFIEYARNHPYNVDGFFGKYLITDIINEQWMRQYPEWQITNELVSKVAKDAINQSLQVIVSQAIKNNEINILYNIIAKTQDVIFKVAKEKGEIKELGLKERRNKTSSNADNDVLNEYLNKIKNTPFVE